MADNLLYGTDEPVPAMRRLVAGPLSVMLDRGNLRYIRWHDREVLRGIAFVVRDGHWGTYAPEVVDLVVEKATNQFAVRYDARCCGPDGDFRYRATIVGTGDGQLSFTAEGASEAGFVTNRTGFVVLHGLDDVVGRPVEVTHASGGSSRSVFPAMITPDQPFLDIRALSHEPVPGLRVSVEMAGETFEMEDQRNWTDASFKTYARPLALGYPYRLEAGEHVAQSVTLSIQGAPRVASAPADISPSIGNTDGTVPALGLFVDPEALDGAEAAAGRIRMIGAAYLLVRVEASGPEAARLIARYRGLAAAAATPLALEVVIAGIDPMRELDSVAAVIRDLPLDSLFVIPKRDLASRAPRCIPDGEASPEAILTVARSVFPGIRLVGGVPVGFAELNRNPPPAAFDVLTHATQAIVHAADDVSVMETLEALPAVVRSARSLAGHARYRLGPATIGLPAPWSASRPIANPDGRRLPMAAEDPRQHGLFAAAFALGVIAAATADALTLAAPTGPFGLFGSGPAAPLARPIAAVFAGLATLTGRPRLSVYGLPETVAAVAADTIRGLELWLANRTAEPVTVALGADFTSITMLDAETLAHSPADAIGPAAFRGPTVKLGRYAVCRLI